jgi:hypothetical protein
LRGDLDVLRAIASLSFASEVRFRRKNPNNSESEFRKSTTCQHLPNAALIIKGPGVLAFLATPTSYGLG